MNRWLGFDHRPQLDQALADHLAGCLRRDIEERGHATLAMSGGSTPLGMLQRLSRCELEWDQVTVTLVDERWVAADHPDSNERMVRENLLQGPAAAARLIGLKTAHATAVEGLAECRRRIAGLTLPFTAVVLGMGGDGHTASWFPRARNLEQLLAPLQDEQVAATDPVTAAHERITLTLPAVLASAEVIIHITGEDKRSVLEAASDEAYPVAAVLAQVHSPVTIWWAP
jgi:6-phosphogluconolactonase